MGHDTAQDCIEAPFGPRVGTKEEYDRAIERLKILSKAPLGTADTAGVQALIDAILEYEGRNGLEKTVLPQSPHRR